MQADDITKILAGLGMGTGTGAVITAIINSRSNRGKARADAADLLVGAAERIATFQGNVEAENRELRSLVKVMHLTALNYLDGTIDRETFCAAVKEWKV